MNRSKTTADSFRHAMNGVLLGFKTQRNLRLHFGLGMLALLGGFVFRLTRAELALVVLAIALVILAELFNTAVETVVDMITQDYHPLAKVAKDVAAGAVLVASIAALLAGLLLFMDLRQLQERFRTPAPYEDAVQTAVIGMVMLMILIAIWKARAGYGRFLHGGIVSGHSAIAFFLCTLILLLAQQPLIGFLAIFMAILVAQSRVEAGVHSLKEVLFGALLGILLPVVLYRVAPVVLGQVAIRLP